jgi:RNA polymerase sigma-70 factor, ECF subfamily
MSPTERKFRQDLVALLPRLRRFAITLSGSADAADDLLHSAVEKAIRAIHGYDPSRRLDSWLFKIMQNTWHDTRKDQSKRRYQQLDDMHHPFADGRNAVEARDELRHVAAAFARLPEEQRAVLALVVLEGFSYNEAASALSIPIGTVMSRLARGRAGIAAVVRPDGALRGVREIGHE